MRIACLHKLLSQYAYVHACTQQHMHASYASAYVSVHRSTQRRWASYVCIRSIRMMIHMMHASHHTCSCITARSEDGRLTRAQPKMLQLLSNMRPEASKSIRRYVCEKTRSWRARVRVICMRVHTHVDTDTDTQRERDRHTHVRDEHTHACTHTHAHTHTHTAEQRCVGMRRFRVG